MHTADIWSPEERKAAYDQAYFNGGGKVGGYAREGYWDYPVHWRTYAEILERKPQSVLELGAARGYILKRLKDLNGIPAYGLEISSHCHATRAIDEIITWDITQTPWPIPDKQFDLLFSVAVLEHIPVQFIHSVAAEMERVSHRGLHGIDFGEHDDDFDKTHCSFHPPEWWKKVLPSTHEIVDKEDLEKQPIPFPISDGKVKLNLGSFTTMYHHGWTNIDVLPLGDWAYRYNFIFRQLDLTQELPYDANVVDLISASHCLEHLTYAHGKKLLAECFRVLKSDGVMRVTVPDAGLLAKCYLSNSMSQFDDINANECTTNLSKFWALLTSGHQSAYDSEELSAMAREVGFTPYIMAFRSSIRSQILAETIDMQPNLSLYIDLHKQT